MDPPNDKQPAPSSSSPPPAPQPDAAATPAADAAPPKPQHWDHPESRSHSAASSDHESRWSSERRVPDKEQQISSPSRDPQTFVSYTHPPPPYHSIHHAMSHRGEPIVMSSRRYDYPKSHELSHPSPPPITTLTNSPSLSTSSLDRSAVSSPAPNGHHHAQSYSAPSYHPYNQGIKQSPKYSYASAHTPSMEPSSGPQNYTYSARAGYDHRYGQEPLHQVPPTYGGALPGVSHIAPSTMRTGGYVNPHGMPSQSDYGIILTDDAATKLSDRVRRRCFNCCTTDTSTWRRSTLNPGKVLCNKCGLFERTHSRPRPDQFPHKRGHITTSTSPRVARTPPPPPPLPQAPPPPHTYSHPSIAPLFARQEQQQWRQQSPPGGKRVLRPVSPTPPSSRSESPSHKSGALAEGRERPA